MDKEEGVSRSHRDELRARLRDRVKRHTINRAPGNDVDAIVSKFGSLRMENEGMSVYNSSIGRRSRRRAGRRNAGGEVLEAQLRAFLGVHLC